MTSTKTKYSISAAARVANKSRTTVASHIKSGKLSLVRDVNGNKLIDASELIRVYGDDCDFDKANTASLPVAKSNPKQVTSGEQVELHTAQHLLDSERTERLREREQLQSRIDHLEDSLKLSQEGHQRATLLLEDRTSGVGDWEKSIRSLEDRISNQEEKSRKEREAIKDQAKRKIEQHRRALEEEKSKSVWQRLFR